MERSSRTHRAGKRTHTMPKGDPGINNEIDIVKMFYRLIENWKYIVATSILGAMVMGVFTFFFITPQYMATSKLYVLNANDAAINLSDFQVGTYLTSDYQEVFNNWIVHERVIQALDLPYSYGKLASMLTVTNPTNTRILYITVRSPYPKEAKEIADTYSKVAQEFIASTMDTKEPSFFEEALLPTAPISPSKTRNIGIGFLAGLLLSAGIICIVFISGDRIRTSDDIEYSVGLTTLGSVSLQHHKTSPGKQEPKRHSNKRKKASTKA